MRWLYLKTWQSNRGSFAIPSQSEHKNILIIGAGVAGLAAARELSNADLQVTVLESRDRIGGRIYTHKGIELGAEFIHGKPPELLKLTERANLKLSPVPNRHWYLRNKTLATSNEFWSKLEKVMEEMKDVEPDQSFSDFLRRHDLGSEAESMAQLYIEGFHASRSERISILGLNKTNAAAEAIDDDKQFRIPNGYGAITQWLYEEAVSQGVHFHLNTTVEEIRWQPNRVEITARSLDALEHYKSSRALITLPLGVLQANTVRFIPELQEKRIAASQLAMGQVVKIVMQFREPFWEDLRLRTKDGAEQSLVDLSFIHAPDELVPTWWTSLPSRTPVLTGWAGGSRAETLLAEGKEAVTNHALKSLVTIFAAELQRIEEQLEDIYSHNWYGDPSSLGAYSYVPVGGLEAQTQLAEPVDKTLFFAGEATNTEGHHGTVHGAYATGVRAARQIINGHK